MPIFSDTEFGEVIVRRSAQARQLRARITPDGRLRISIPLFTSLTTVKRFISSSRSTLRELAQNHPLLPVYTANMQIGKSHTLTVITAPKLKITVHKQKIILALPPDVEISSEAPQQLIRTTVTKILRREAKAYLTRRLAFLAAEHGFSYQKLRFSHAGSRWGSCSSAGTISLNIALMKLPHELIDYVLCHELCHTRHMDHSSAFWQEVSQLDPAYSKHRQQLREHHPYV